MWEAFVWENNHVKREGLLAASPRLVTKTDVAPCVGIKAKTVAFSTTFEAMKKPANVSLFTRVTQ